MAKKINLSSRAAHRMGAMALWFCLCFPLAVSLAQVPPRLGVVGQRADTKPRKDEPIKWVTATTSEWFIRTETTSCILTIHGSGGKEAELNFCGDEVTYKGELKVGEAARVFFQVVFGEAWKDCKEKREE